MYLLILALVLLGLKLAGVEPVAHWSWWWVLSPFALAALWWLWSDLSGRTKRLAMKADEQRKAERLAEAKKRLRSGGAKG
jgi:small Trp-rich protein